MTCKEIEDLLPGMIDGALPETEKKRIEAHLETCASCRKAFADLRMSDERVKSLEEVEPPPWLKTRVMARVREEAGQKEGILPEALLSASRQGSHPGPCHGSHRRCRVECLQDGGARVQADGTAPGGGSGGPAGSGPAEPRRPQGQRKEMKALQPGRRRPSHRPPRRCKNRRRSERQPFVKRQRPMPKSPLSG